MPMRIVLAEDINPRPVMIHPVLLDGKPVWDGGADAVIRGLRSNGDGFLSVRASPSIKATELDRLTNGRFVLFFTGDPQADKNGFVGVVYSDGAGNGAIREICKVPGDFYDGAYNGPCKSGWVFHRFVEIQAD